MTVKETRWQVDEHSCLNLWTWDKDGELLHIWIAPRQHYCDRGHWSVHADAPSLWLDGSDGFPRYFMDLETAIRETETWLRWRLYRHTATPVFADLIHAHDGRLAAVEEPSDEQ
jgi:hypothetical protein